MIDSDQSPLQQMIATRYELLSHAFAGYGLIFAAYLGSADGPYQAVFGRPLGGLN